MDRLALTLRNRQTTRPVDLRVLRRILRELLRELLSAPAADLGVYLIAAREMTGLNGDYLGHAGSTDVITFDYGDGNDFGGGTATESSSTLSPGLHGEIFICVDDAVIQAERFHTTWTAEVVRYAVHGILHLRGFDDIRSSDRRKMKREERRLLDKLADRFNLERLAQGEARKPSGPD